MYPWIYNVCVDAVIKRVENRNGEDRSEISGEGEKAEINWSLVCRVLDFV